MRNSVIGAAILILASAISTDAPCQITFDQPGSFALKFIYSRWSVEAADDPKETLSQTTFAFTGFEPIRDNFEARYQIVAGRNDLGAGDAAWDMSGLGDVRLQLAHSFSNDRLLLSAGFNLPTGKTKLDLESEQRIIEFLSRDYLSVPLRRFGAGFGLNLQAGGAIELVNLTASVDVRPPVAKALEARAKKLRPLDLSDLRSKDLVVLLRALDPQDKEELARRAKLPPLIHWNDLGAGR